jgi:nucleoside-triphosphatase THEP1
MLVWLIGDHRQGKTTTCQRLADQARTAGMSVAGLVQPAVYEGGACVGYDVLDLASGLAAPLARIVTSGVAQRGGAAAQTEPASVKPVKSIQEHSRGQRRFPSPAAQVGRFCFLPEGLGLGRRALEHAASSPTRLIIVDEVGPLELSGGGWSQQLDALVGGLERSDTGAALPDLGAGRGIDPEHRGRHSLLLLTVRRALVAEAAARWGGSIGGGGPSPAPLFRDLALAPDTLLESIIHLLKAQQ